MKHLDIKDYNNCDPPPLILFKPCPKIGRNSDHETSYILKWFKNLEQAEKIFEQTWWLKHRDRKPMQYGEHHHLDT